MGRDIPDLSRRMMLERRARAADGAGGGAAVWAPVATHWVEVRVTGGREVEEGGRLTGRITHRIRLRAAAHDDAIRPRASDRLSEAGRIFEILAVAEEGARGAYLTCWVQEGALA